MNYRNTLHECFGDKVVCVPPIPLQKNKNSLEVKTAMIHMFFMSGWITDYSIFTLSPHGDIC